MIKLFKSPSKKQMIYEACFLLIIFLVLSKILYSPLIKRIDKLRKELDALSGEVIIAKKISKVEQDAYAKTQMKAERFLFFRREFCKEKDFSGLLNQITSLVPDSKLELVSFNYRPQEVFRLHKQIPIELNLNGQYGNLLQYLRQMEKLSRSIDINELEIQANLEAGTSMKIKMVIMNYILRE